MPSMSVPECGSPGGRHQCRLSTARIMARILCSEPANGGPIEALAALRKQAQKSITQQASERHGYPKTLGRSQREPDVLESKRRSEARRLELAFGDEGAVGFVCRYVEHRGGEEFDVRARIDPGLTEIGRASCRERV